MHWIGVPPLVERYHLVFRYKGFHDAPADKVGGGADAEDDEVAGRFSGESQEGQVDLLGVNEELTSHFLEEH